MYWRAIYAYALRFGMPHDDAQDAVQEVFIKIFRSLPRFEYDSSKGRFLSWVKTITRTTVLDLHRRRMARVEGQVRVGATDATQLPAEQIIATDARHGDDGWEEEWELSLLSVALERVKERVEDVTYEAFRMYALEDRPPQEVAEALGIKASAVYVYKGRVLEHIRQEVAAIRNET